MIIGFLVVFIVLLILGVPMVFTLAGAAFIYILTTHNIPLTMLAQQMFTSSNSYALMAIPFFLLAGELMNKARITEKIVDFSQALIGWIRGGLAQVAIIATMIFSGISGSAVADAAAVGSVLIPSMKDKGYGAEKSAALVSAASVIGPIVPPSITIVIYGISTNTSIAAMFAAGIIPGIIVGVALMITAFFVYRKSLDKTPFSWTKLLRSSWQAILAIIMPLIIVGGIVGGVFTPTEAGAVAVLYALIIGLLVFKTLRMRDIYQAILSAGIQSSTVLLVIAASSPVGWVLSVNNVPQLVATSFSTSSPFIFLLLVIAMMLVFGMFMETPVVILIMAPILVPIATSLGISPIHFGIVMILTLLIGLIHPPIGLSLFITSPIAGTTMENVTKAIWPYLLVELVVLLLLAYIPSLTTAIPSMMGYS